MTEITPQIVVIIMLGGLFLGVFSGFPLAYIVGFLGLVMGIFVWQEQVAEMLYLRVVSLLLTYQLLAVPLFVFMGAMLERSGIIEKLYEALYLWLGGLRGGLAVVTLIVGTIMAATVGVITASVTMLTLIALPSMIKRGYSKSFASGCCCAGGVLGILIPPSIMIIIYASMANLPIGKMLFGAFFPGFVLAGLYISFVVIRSFLQPNIAPPVPVEQRAVPLIRKVEMLVVSLMPPAILVMSVLGVIFFGIAAPTEAAGVGAFAATLLTIAYRRFSWKVLLEVMTLTAKLSAFILLVGSMSFAFTGVFLGAGGGKVVTEAILAMPGGRWGAFAAIMFVIFLLGFFVDWIGIVFIMVPIMTPIFQALGFDIVWSSIMVCVNLQTSFLTPPFAMAIYVCKGAADPSLAVNLTDIMRGVVPYILLILIGMVLFIIWPEIILWLPGKMITR